MCAPSCLDAIVMSIWKLIIEIVVSKFVVLKLFELIQFPHEYIGRYVFSNMKNNWPK